MISIEVVYAAPDRIGRYALTLKEGSTLRDAVLASGVLRDFPDIDLATHPVGVFGRRAPLDRVAADGDRVEIYRRLIADPKDARRARARNRKNAR